MATNTLSSSKITLLAIAASRLALLSSLLHKGHGRLPHRAVLCLQLEAQEGGKNSLRQVRHWYLGEATSFKVLVNSTSSQGHGFGVPIHLEDDINQKQEMSEKGEDSNEKSQPGHDLQRCSERTPSSCSSGKSSVCEKPSCTSSCRRPCGSAAR